MMQVDRCAACQRHGDLVRPGDPGGWWKSAPTWGKMRPQRGKARFYSPQDADTARRARPHPLLTLCAAWARLLLRVHASWHMA